MKYHLKALLFLLAFWGTLVAITTALYYLGGIFQDPGF